MSEHEDTLMKALAQLRQEGLLQDVPKDVVDETLRKMADCQSRLADSATEAPAIRSPQSAIRNLFRLAVAAAVFAVLGYGVGRLSVPKPMSLDQLQEALTPAVAASIEPAIRQKVIEDMRHNYQLALAGTYVRVKEELTEQYRSDLNRFAVQMLAASNAVTNQLLTELVRAIDTAKAEDLRRIAQALYEIERNRVQDKTQLASGLQTLASRTQDEISRTRQQFVQLLVDVQPQGSELPTVEPSQTDFEGNKP